MKSINDSPYLEKTPDQFEWKAYVFYQRTPVETCYVNSFDLISCLRHFLHFHFSFCPNEQNICVRIQSFQRIGNCNCRENVSAGSSSCYDDFFVQCLMLNAQYSMFNVQWSML